MARRIEHFNQGEVKAECLFCSWALTVNNGDFDYAQKKAEEHADLFGHCVSVRTSKEIVLSPNLDSEGGE